MWWDSTGSAWRDFRRQRARARVPCVGVACLWLRASGRGAFRWPASLSARTSPCTDEPLRRTGYFGGMIEARTRATIDAWEEPQVVSSRPHSCRKGRERPQDDAPGQRVKKERRSPSWPSLDVDHRVERMNCSREPVSRSLQNVLFNTFHRLSTASGTTDSDSASVAL